MELYLSVTFYLRHFSVTFKLFGSIQVRLEFIEYNDITSLKRVKINTKFTFSKPKLSKFNILNNKAPIGIYIYIQSFFF